MPAMPEPESSPSTRRATAQRLLPPRRLKAHATVGVFSPSEPVTRERFNSLLRGISILETHGYRVKLSPNVRAATNHTAGTVQQRLDDFHALIEDDSVDVVLASWGGKSSAQLLPYLDYALVAKARKPICAFSDGGVLLNAISARTGLITFYGPNVLGKLHETSHADLAPLRAGGYGVGTGIFGTGSAQLLTGHGVLEGVLIGGNLSTYMQSIPGTDYEGYVDGGIFFWESGPKTTQELDTLLTPLVLHRYVERLAGMIVGHVTILHDERWGDESLPILLERLFRNRTMPIVSVPRFGHGALQNPIIPIGCRARLDPAIGDLILLDEPLAD